MAKATLPTNFKDDILASSMGSKRRYNVINNSDGTISLEDVTTYTQVGSTFGAAQINATNKAVNASADASKIIDDYDTLMANTQAGCMAGALAVKELNSNLTSIITKSGSTPLTANAATPLVCADNIENGTYLVIFMYAFEANTQGHVTLVDVVSSGYTTHINNYVQVCGFAEVKDNKVTVTLYSTSNQSSRSWITKLIKLG